MSRQALSAQALQRWNTLLDAFEKSGLTQAEFIRREGLPKASFYTWHRRLRPQQGTAKRSPSVSSPSPKTIRRAPRKAAAKKSTPNFIELAVANTAKALPNATAPSDHLEAIGMIFTGIGQLLRSRS